MIYHMLKYLQDEFPSYNIASEATQATTNKHRILVRESVGASQGYPDNKIEAQMQVIVNDADQFETRKKALAIFDYLRDRHNVTLQPHPDSTDSELFVRRIVAVQPPSSNGQQENGSFQYSNNYLLTYQYPVL